MSPENASTFFNFFQKNILFVLLTQFHCFFPGIYSKTERLSHCFIIAFSFLTKRKGPSVLFYVSSAGSIFASQPLA